MITLVLWGLAQASAPVVYIQQPAKAGELNLRSERIETLLNSIPKNQDQQAAALSAEQNKIFNDLNPGREGQVAPIVSRYVSCVEAANDDFVRKSQRLGAASLSDDEINSLMRVVKSASSEKEVFSSPVARKWIDTTYDKMQELKKDPGVVDALVACTTAKVKDLIAQGLNYKPKPAP